MAKKVKSFSSFADLLVDAAKENLGSDITKQIHKASERKKIEDTEKRCKDRNKKNVEIKKGISKGYSSKKNKNGISKKNRASPVPRQRKKKPVKANDKLSLLGSYTSRKVKEDPSTLAMAHGIKRKISPLTFSDEIQIPRALTADLDQMSFRPVPSSWRDVDPVDDGDLDLVIGLDFGSSFTKVIIRDVGAKRCWAVPISINRENPYISRSSLFMSGSKFSLYSGEKCFSGLKMPLLNGAMSLDDKTRVVAYLALVIRYIKMWMVNENHQALRGLSPFWILNIGLPAKDFEDKPLLRSYYALSWCAMLLSKVEDFNESKICALIDDAETQVASISDDDLIKRNFDDHALNSDYSQNLGVINVFPEIMAQMAGFVRSKFWDVSNPEFMIIDVGGGTVDQTIFNVVKQRETSELTFAVFKANVDSNGSLVLHEKRLEWLISQFKTNGAMGSVLSELEDLYKNRFNVNCIPKKITHYINGASFGEFTFDNDFEDKFISESLERLRCVISKSMRHFHRSNRPFPVILSGGGSRSDVYKNLSKCKAVTAHNIRIQLGMMRLPVPEDLVTYAISDTDYDRISVAYGLSYENLGTLITPDNIKDLCFDDDIDDSSNDEFVSKDMV